MPLIYTMGDGSDGLIERNNNLGKQYDIGEGIALLLALVAKYVK